MVHSAIVSLGAKVQNERSAEAFESWHDATSTS